MDTAATKSALDANGKAKWTWLIYMAGDNNLQSSAVDNLNDMSRVGSNGDMHIVAQFDAEKSRTKRIHVSPGKLDVVDTMANVDSGDPRTLTDFLVWGKKTYPAERYAVVVWNHGGGLEDIPIPEIDWHGMRGVHPLRQARREIARKALFRKTAEAVSAAAPAEPARLIAVDVGSRDYLDNKELRTAVEKAGPFDLFGCDACLMNMVEIAYEMRKTADVMVGSEQTEPAHGWAYSEIFRWLGQNPDAKPGAVAAEAVSTYHDYYGQHREATTQSALSLGTSVEAVAHAIDALANALIASMDGELANIVLARRSTLAFETADYVDLLDFVKNLESRTNNAALAGPIAQIRQAAAACVLASAATGSTMTRASGMSIWFPATAASDLMDIYAKLQFAKDTAWLRFLQAYFSH